jgi:hypothetical protein
LAKQNVAYMLIIQIDGKLSPVPKRETAISVHRSPNEVYREKNLLISFAVHVCYITCPSYSNLRRGVGLKILELLNSLFLSFLHVALTSSRFPPSILFSNTLSLFSSLHVNGQNSYPYRRRAVPVLSLSLSDLLKTQILLNDAHYFNPYLTGNITFPLPSPAG